jgi:wyosine [tRNA(Phe)-imidazoG37] synthetase (radical SAM superfamily)
MNNYIAFGPVPSRRLGRSLGINNIYDKTCSYSCVYCQLGKTTDLYYERKKFYTKEQIYESARNKVNKAINRNEKIDYITFVPDGEPTIDINLGKEIIELKKLGIKIAVITNSSLIYREEVRNDLYEADLVSLKIDSVDNDLWVHINRPHPKLKLNEIKEGIEKFTKEYKGKIITETMLIGNINYEGVLSNIGEFIKSLKNVDTSYLSIPIRPPADKGVVPPSEKMINEAYHIMASILGESKVEYLIGYEGSEFSYTGNTEENLLSIMSVHPMREEAVHEFLKKANEDSTIIDKLIKENKVVKLFYENKTFYMRKIKSQQN